MNESTRKLALLATIILGLAVVMGAFGAHGLKDLVTSERMQVYRTAVEYHVMHGIVLFLLAMTHQHLVSKWLNWSGIFMMAGLVLFSGSLYLLVITDVTLLGMITPLGGLTLIAAWIFFALGVYSGVGR